VVAASENLDGLMPAELNALLLELLGQVRDAEIARLKSLKSRR